MKIKHSILAVSIFLTLSGGPIYGASVDSYIIDAEKYIEKKDFRAAVIQLKNALQKAPDNVDARTRLGKLYLTLGDGPSAEKEFRRGRKHGAKPEDWMSGLADAMLLQRKEKEVLSVFFIKPEMAAKLKADVFSRLAHANFLSQKPAEAKALFGKALGENPDHVFSLLGGARVDAGEKNFKDAGVKVSRAISLEPDNVAALILEAELAAQQGKFEVAKTKFENILQKRPNYIPALSGQVSSLIALNENDEALVRVNKILTMSPNSPLANYQLGLINVKKNNIGVAEDALNNVLKVVDNHMPSLLLLGRIKYLQNNFEQAEKFSKQFYSVFPNHIPNL